MSNPIISIVSIRRLRLQNTRFLRATSISVVDSPRSTPSCGSTSVAIPTIRPIVACLGYIRDMVVPPAWNRSSEPFAELLSAAAIAARVAELGAQITADYAPLSCADDVVVVGVLKGSVIFLADLVRQIAAPVYLEF